MSSCRPNDQTSKSCQLTHLGSYRISIWTRDAPDTSLSETDALMASIVMIGKHFKASVLGYDAEKKLVSGGLQSEVTFESHKDSEKKGNKNKINV